MTGDTLRHENLTSQIVCLGIIYCSKKINDRVCLSRDARTEKNIIN